MMGLELEREAGQGLELERELCSSGERQQPIASASGGRGSRGGGGYLARFSPLGDYGQ